MESDNNLSVLEKFDSQLAMLIARAQKSLVQVHVDGRGNGAGTIVHGDGLIVTNAHVVQRRRPRITLANGRKLTGSLLASDERLDLAAVSVEAENLPVIPLANGKGVKTGQMVIALGHPWGVQGASTAGMVIALGKPLDRLPYEGPLIQVGCHLRPGHSGGPMIDDQGRLVGINTMIAGPQVGLAIPIQTVKRFLKTALGSNKVAAS